MKKRRTVFLVCPYGQVGGGMGSIMAYLASLRHDPEDQFDLIPLESRGAGSIAWSPIYLACAVARITAEALLGRLAVVHLNLAERGSVFRKAVLLAATKAVGGKVLLHLHAAQIVRFHTQTGPITRKILRTMFLSANHCVVLGETWRQWVIETFGVRPENVTVVYNGVPATTQERRSRADHGTFELLFVGNLLERKGVKDLLLALASPALRDRKLRLTMAGGGAVEHFQAMAAELNIADRVVFTGWVSQADARHLMVDADTLILPAYDEGLPLVILEALASRTSVICTPVGSIPEVLTDRKNALFVTPGNIPEIAAAIAELADEPAIRMHLSESGAYLYQQLFTMDSFARTVGSIYTDLVWNSRANSRTHRLPLVGRVR